MKNRIAYCLKNGLPFLYFFVLSAIVLFLPYAAFSQHDEPQVLSQSLAKNQNYHVLIGEYLLWVLGILMVATQALGKIIGEFGYLFLRLWAIRQLKKYFTEEELETLGKLSKEKSIIPTNENEKKSPT